MTKNFNILFYLRKDKEDKDGKVPIYARVTVNGKRAEIAIKRYVMSEKWISGSEVVKGNSEEARTINTYINSLY